MRLPLTLITAVSALALTQIAAAAEQGKNVQSCNLSGVVHCEPGTTLMPASGVSAPPGTNHGLPKHDGGGDKPHTNPISVQPPPPMPDPRN